MPITDPTLTVLKNPNTGEERAFGNADLNKQAITGLISSGFQYTSGPKPSFLNETAPAPVRRYPLPGSDTTGELSALGGEIAGKPREVTPDQEEQVREAARKRVQASIDAVREVYSGLVRSETERGVDRLGRTRAIAARSGLVGSSFGEAQRGETERLNAENIRAIEAEQALKIQSILGEADEKAQVEIDKQRAAASKNSEDYLKFLEDRQTKVKSDITALAKTGLGYTDFVQKVGGDKLQTYLRDSGFTPGEFEIYYNANLPQEKQADYHFEKVGDSVRVWKFSPTTGKLERRAEMDFAGVPGSTAGEYKTVTDGTGQVYLLPETIDFSKPLDQQGVKIGAPKPVDGFGEPTSQDESAAVNWATSQVDENKNPIYTQEDLNRLKTDRAFFSWVLQQAKLAGF